MRNLAVIKLQLIEKLAGSPSLQEWWLSQAVFFIKYLERFPKWELARGKTYLESKEGALLLSGGEVVAFFDWPTLTGIWDGGVFLGLDLVKRRCEYALAVSPTIDEVKEFAAKARSARCENMKKAHQALTERRHLANRLNRQTIEETVYSLEERLGTAPTVSQVANALNTSTTILMTRMEAYQMEYDIDFLSGKVSLA